MAKKNVVRSEKKRVPIKSVTLSEQNPASTDVEALVRTLTKKSSKKKK